MRGGRYGKYGEVKRNERLKASREAKREFAKKSGKLKNRSGPKVRKFEYDKNFSLIKEETNNGKTICKCGNEMKFYGVDGNGGSKYYCGGCYEKKIVS